MRYYVVLGQLSVENKCFGLFSDNSQTKSISKKEALKNYHQTIKKKSKVVCWDNQESARIYAEFLTNELNKDLPRPKYVVPYYEVEIGGDFAPEREVISCWGDKGLKNFVENDSEIKNGERYTIHVELADAASQETTSSHHVLLYASAAIPEPLAVDFPSNCVRDTHQSLINNQVVARLR